jgi:8-oxo-dGTP pyrophosphatase MutT (NUDIX family)
MIKKLSSKIVYKNRWMTVKEDEVEFENGVKSIYGVVDKPDFSLVVPFEEGKFYMVKQYRYPVQNSYWEFPQGSNEENPDIDPKRLALDELEEETGLIAKKIKHLGFLHGAYGYSPQGCNIFLASDFSKGQQKLEDGEQGLEVKRFSIAEFEKMIKSGEIRGSNTVSAYGLLKVKQIL